MSEITIKDRVGDELTLEIVHRTEHPVLFIYMSCPLDEYQFDDPAELKRLAEFILSNLEKEG